MVINGETDGFEDFPHGSVVKNFHANAGGTGAILGQENPLEKEMETYSSFLAWRIPWTEEPGGLSSMGLQNNQTQPSD